MVPLDFPWRSRALYTDILLLSEQLCFYLVNISGVCLRFHWGTRAIAPPIVRQCYEIKNESQTSGEDRKVNYSTGSGKKTNKHERTVKKVQWTQKGQGSKEGFLESVTEKWGKEAQRTLTLSKGGKKNATLWNGRCRLERTRLPIRGEGWELR